MKALTDGPHTAGQPLVILDVFAWFTKNIWLTGSPLSRKKMQPNRWMHCTKIPFEAVLLICRRRFVSTATSSAATPRCFCLPFGAVPWAFYWSLFCFNRVHYYKRPLVKLKWVHVWHVVSAGNLAMARIKVPVGSPINSRLGSLMVARWKHFQTTIPPIRCLTFVAFWSSLYTRTMCCDWWKWKRCYIKAQGQSFNLILG